MFLVSRLAAAAAAVVAAVAAVAAVTDAVDAARRAYAAADGSSLPCGLHLLRQIPRYEKQKAKYVYTWEVFGDLKAHNDDCFRMFNPVRASHCNAK